MLIKNCKILEFKKFSKNVMPYAYEIIHVLYQK